MNEYEVHVPVEQYGFISATIKGFAHDAAKEYHEIKHSIGFGDGMPEHEFRKYYDLVASGTAINGDPGILEQMNAVQRFAINEIKKYIKRASIKLSNNHEQYIPERS